MMSPGAIELHAWWMELQRMALGNAFLPIDAVILSMMFDDAIKEKDCTETDQIMARLMYKQCFSYIAKHESEGMTLRKKFRYLALYYFCTKQYQEFGKVVLSSIIREWPVPISFAEENRGDPYIWDRAPISIAMKDCSIRKDACSYVIRVLALEEVDIGTILMKAEANTQLLAVEENGLERATKAFIIELNREGPSGKREASTAAGSGAAKRVKARAAKNKEDSSSPSPPVYFEAGFEHLPGHDGSRVFNCKHGRKQAEFVAKGSKNVIFPIQNISIIDNDTRSTINQKYCMRTHFEFTFEDNRFSPGIVFHVQSTDYGVGPLSDPNLFLYQMAVKSMSFEASSNPSTHWKKSMSAIWDTLYQFYFRMGMLNDKEKELQGSKLAWCRVRDMITHFISCRSDIHVRPLLDTELRTVSRMILARHLFEFNAEVVKQKKWPTGSWNIDTFIDSDKKKIEERYLRKHAVIKPGETYTQALNREMQGVKLPDGYLIKLSDFTETLVVLSSGEPEEASCSIYSWLHGTAEIISGQQLHSSCPKTSVRMFNRYIITLCSAESARRTVEKILKLDETGRRTDAQNTKVLMIRLDEREEWRILLEMIEPAEEHPYHFGFYLAKAIKETKLPLAKQQDPPCVFAAREEGVISKTKLELCGLFAVLKTGYLRGFRRVVVSDPNKLAIRQIFKGDNANSDAVYNYDFEPSAMKGNEVNPIIGPIITPTRDDFNDEVYSMTESMATISVKPPVVRPTQQIQQMQQQIVMQSMQLQQQEQMLLLQQQQQQQPVFATPNFNSQHAYATFIAQQQQQQQQQLQPDPFALNSQPNIPSVLQQPVQQPQQAVQHNHFYDGPPPYQSYPQDTVTYATQGIQAQYPFTPPDPNNQLPSPAGIDNPNYQQI